MSSLNAMNRNTRKASSCSRSFSFRPDLWILAGLVLLLNLHILGIGTPAPFIFYPAAVQQGQWWRLWTHPFVHLTWYHFALDAGAFFLLYRSLAEKRIDRRLLYLCMAGLSSLSAALLLAPEFDELGLCGLSGIAHGLMAVSGLEMIADKRHRLVGFLSFGSVAAKSVYESIQGRVVFEFLHMGLCGTPLAVCHLGGVAGSTLLFFLFFLWDRKKQRAIDTKGRFPSGTDWDGGFPVSL